MSAGIALAQHATITVDASRAENHVSPRMYGAFMEIMAEDVKRGLTAEMLHDRSFEDTPDYLGLPVSWQIEPDERNDSVGDIRFRQISEDAYPRINRATNLAEHSLEITLTPGDFRESRRGLSQGGLALVGGVEYRGYFWAKKAANTPFSGNVLVSLEQNDTDGETYARASLPLSAGDGWQQYSFSLTPKQTDRFAKLSFLFEGEGTLLLDQASLQRGDAKTQVRADSEAMVAKLRPSFIRWPGGNVAQDYHWEWGIGPRDLRPIWRNTAWSNAPEPNDLGIDEYLAFCARVGAEPSITVNVNGAGATAEEAAAWVEYVNGPATAKFGAMRAANGHPAPYSVKQWELGNEIYGNWVRGHADAESYAKAARQYAAAMRKVDSTIKLTAVGQGLGKDQDAWNSAVLKIAGPVIDYLAIHDYTSRSSNAKAADARAQMMIRAAEFERSYLHTAQLIERLAPGRNIRQIVNEWNLFYGVDVVESIEGAIYASRMMNGFERAGGAVEANCISDLLNGWIGGIIQASRDRVYGTPQYYAIQMYNDALGTDRLHADVRSPDLHDDAKSVDAVATAKPDRSEVYVKVSNAARDPVQLEIDLLNFEPATEVLWTALEAAGPLKRNSFSVPDAVKPVKQTLRCNRQCTVELPPASVHVFTFRKH